MLPRVQESSVMMNTAISIIDKELKRVEELSQDALNHPQAKNKINEELKKMGYDYIF